ncbi:unnamed protein product [Brachionus calyciflorus]|uniref:Uncharacterized protein n=1 Tax=Brachionus calyciflorus TaxID=104777 RepID=A0A813WKH6_9BILA|nr:unnamed protein product [Brachionus calyciflorus]
MFLILKKLNGLSLGLRNVRCLSQLNSSTISSETIISHNILSQNITNNTSLNKKIINYKCPSIKSFQLPINDFKITDIIKRHELTLPEINKKKEIFDPLLQFQIEKELPKNDNNLNKPMYCGGSLFSEVKWRSRKMNIKKRKKYQRKMFYVIQKRRQAKEKRYNNLMELYKSIHEKKSELFDPIKFVNRELEKAKFFGFKANPVYDEYRNILNDKVKTFDEKYFRKFEDLKKPLHIRLEEELNQENNKK